MALKFLTEPDFKGILGASVLASLKGADSVNLAESELRSISELDPLRAKFDIDGMLAKVANERHPVLIRILVHITAYYLYNTVPDDDIPDRIVDNWKKELLFIKELASGKASSTLDNLTNETTGEKVTNFRWGSNKRRSHDLYS